MQVIAHEPHFWLLLKSDEGYILDVNCNYSAVGFNRMVKLNETELAEFIEKGRSFADEMAKTISNTPSSFTSRHIEDQELGERAHLAITQWMDAHRANGWPPRL